MQRKWTQQVAQVQAEPGLLELVLLAQFATGLVMELELEWPTALG